MAKEFTITNEVRSTPGGSELTREANELAKTIWNGRLVAKPMSLICTAVAYIVTQLVSDGMDLDAFVDLVRKDMMERERDA